MLIGNFYDLESTDTLCINLIDVDKDISVYYCDYELLQTMTPLCGGRGIKTIKNPNRNAQSKFSKNNLPDSMSAIISNISTPRYESQFPENSSRS